MANFKWTDTSGYEWRVLETQAVNKESMKTFCIVTEEGSDYRYTRAMWIPTGELEVSEDPGPTYDVSGNDAGEHLDPVAGEEEETPAE